MITLEVWQFKYCCVIKLHLYVPIYITDASQMKIYKILHSHLHTRLSYARDNFEHVKARSTNT